MLKHEDMQSSIEDLYREEEGRALALSYLIRNLFEAKSLDECLDVAIKGLSMLDFFQSQISLLENSHFVVKRNHMDKKYQFLLEKIAGMKFLGHRIDTETSFISHLLNSKIVTTLDIKDTIKVKLEDFIREFLPRELSKGKRLGMVSRIVSVIPRRIDLLILPLDYQGKIIGAVGISSTSLGRDDFLFLKNLCELFTQAFEKMQRRDDLIRLSSAVKMSTDSIVISDIDGKIIDVNEATLKMYGTDDKEDLIGKNSFDLIAPEERERAFAGMKEVVEKGYLKSREYHIITKDGGTTPVEMSAAIMKDADGKPIGFVGISRDFTERKKMEEALELQRDIAVSLSGTRDLSEALNRLFDNLLEIEEFDCAGFYLVDNDTRTLDMIVHRGLPDRFVEKVGHLGADSPYAKVIIEGKPVYQKTSDFPPIIREDLQSDGILAVAAIPIQHEGEVIGDLNMASHTHEEISAFTRNVLESVGAQIGESIVRARMEEALRESENRLKQLIEYAPDAIYMNDLKGNFLDGNKQAESLTGYSKEELIGKNFLKIGLLPKRYLPRAAKLLMKNSFGKKTGPDEFELIRKDGKRITAEISTFLVKRRGKAEVVGIARDITERKRFEERLSALSTYTRNLNMTESMEEIYRLTLDAMEKTLGFEHASFMVLEDNMLCVVDQRGYPESLSIKLPLDETKRGITIKAAITGRPVFVPDTTKERAYVQGMPGIRSELAVPIKIGHRVLGILNVESKRLNALDEKDQRLLEILASHAATAISNLRYSKNLEAMVEKRTEELLESEKRYSVVVEEASDGVVILQDGKIAFTNKKGPEIVGYSRDELVGLPFEKLLHGKYRQLVKERYERRLRGEKVPATYEIELKSKTGERVQVEIGSDLIHYQGRPADLVIVRDIRERKRIEEERLKLEKLATIGELATMVGHDLRNPLQAITNAVYVLKDLYATVDSALEHYNKVVNLLPEPIAIQIHHGITETFEKRNKMIHAIDESIRYANKIVSDLQNFARTTEPKLVEVDLKSLIEGSLSDVSIPENVKISIRYKQTMPKLHVDPTQIRRVFTNLTANAIQAMPNGGELTISTSLKDGSASIAFQDTGVGIPKENRKKLFTPLFTTRAKGLGMGLAICKKFIDAHGGSIEVESEEDKGSTFTVKLPMQQESGGETR